MYKTFSDVLLRW